MEHRQLGASGLFVPVPSYETATFSKVDGFGFAAVHGAEARRIVDMCLDAGLNMFDSADVYSGGHNPQSAVLGSPIRQEAEKTWRTAGCWPHLLINPFSWFPSLFHTCDAPCWGQVGSPLSA
jgi:aryl-alcohol dehydrogenase-like predicted oxidoreductase